MASLTVPKAMLQQCADIGRSLTSSHAEKLAGALAVYPNREGADDVAFVVPAAAFTATAQRLLHAWAQHPEVPGWLIGPAIAAAAHAHELARTDPHVQLVMSGPESEHVHPRLTDQVLLDVVGGAQHELMLVTFALYMYEDLRRALTSAIARGVHVTVLAEDPKDHPGYAGDPASALAGIGVQRLRWPIAERADGAAAMHAKLVLADRSVVFITSANLTAKAARHNLEAGLLVKGGDIASRVARHLEYLRATGVLQAVT